MVRSAVRRLLITIPVMLVVSFAVFLLMEFAPGDPAARLAGEDFRPERIAQIRQELRLDDPLLERYGRWLGDAVQGDLGRSLATRQPVTEMLSEKFAVTASLAVVALVLSVGIGLLLGILAAVRANRLLDRVITSASALAIAVPTFWMGLVLVMLFAVNRTWFPALGYKPIADGWWEWLSHLILPGIALAAQPGAELALQMKAALIEVSRRDYITTAHAKGLAPRTVIGKHALKNASVPVVTVLGYRIAQMLGGTVAIEAVFSLNGLGSLALASALGSDVPVLLAITVTTTLIVALANLLVDISYGYFNPKVIT